ncbi:MAG: C-GCAxxG-C-C family protein [Planctomycetia bacterium]|nr:C-GCAxxG-C-C family protein [Planctomycetia bacterium]
MVSDNYSAKAEKARQLFLEGANCAQAVVMAFEDECGLDALTLARLASGFGGGIGRLREVCGAVSGMVLAANLMWGSSDLSDKFARDTQYARIQTLVGRFREETGSIICRELLGLEKKQSDSHISEPRTEAYYKKRPCVEMVALAARILEEYYDSMSYSSPKAD